MQLNSPAAILLSVLLLPTLRRLQSPHTGKKCKALTATEFTEIMVTQYKPWIQRVVDSNPGVFPNGMRSVLIMMDGAAWHRKAVNKEGLLDRMGMLPSQLLEHPPCSPDFQAPIEQSHSALVREVRQRLAQDARIKSARQIKRLFKDVWEGDTFTVAEGRRRRAKEPLLTPQQIDAQFRKLAKTYEQVHQADGDWGRKGN
jgi:transposase